MLKRLLSLVIIACISIQIGTVFVSAQEFPPVDTTTTTTPPPRDTTEPGYDAGGNSTGAQTPTSQAAVAAASCVSQRTDGRLHVRQHHGCPFARRSCTT